MKRISQKHIFALGLMMLFIASCSNSKKETVSFYENSKPKLVYFYSSSENKEKIKEIMYYQDGKIKHEGNFKDNNRIGIWIFNYENGRNFAKINFKNDGNTSCEIKTPNNKELVTKNDEITQLGFDEMNNLNLIRLVRADRTETEYMFYPSFALAQEIYSHGNILNGVAAAYFENGNLKSESHFKDGMQDSLYFVYFENGNIALKGRFKADNKVGKWEYFNNDGSGAGVEYYLEDGSLYESQYDTGIKLYGKDGKEIIVKQE